MPEILLELHEFRQTPNIVGITRSRESHVNNFLNSPGACSHQEDPVCQRDRFLHVVSHEFDGPTVFLPDLKEFFLHASEGLLVQGTKGLIHQQDGRRDNQCTRQPNTLLHPA